jgi:polysaccharide export outer membrane protein
MASIHRPALVHVSSGAKRNRIAPDVIVNRKHRPVLARSTLRGTWLALCLAGASSTLAPFGGLGCRSRGGVQHVDLPPPTERGLLGAGDVFTMQIVGEKDLPTDYQVAADGTVGLPFVGTIKVLGLEAPEVARVIRNLLIERKILDDPSVIVQVKEFHSRRITLLGQISKPGSYPFTPGLTLLQVLSQAGGLTAIADEDRVNITRKGEKGKTRTAVVSAGYVMQGSSPDIPLQAGDQIYVHERLF